MPTYEYACSACGQEHEIFQRMSDDPIEICPACEAPAMKRKIGRGAGIIFKGGGFYETDFKDKKGGGSGSNGAASPSQSSSGAESAPAPAAKESAAPAKADAGNASSGDAAS